MGLAENIRANFNKRQAVSMIRLGGGDYVNYDPAKCTFTAFTFNKPMEPSNQKTFEACIRKGGLAHTKAEPVTHRDEFGGNYYGFSWVLSLPAKAEESQQISLI